MKRCNMSETVLIFTTLFLIQMSQIKNTDYTSISESNWFFEPLHMNLCRLNLCFEAYRLRLRLVPYKIVSPRGVFLKWLMLHSEECLHLLVTDGSTASGFCFDLLGGQGWVAAEWVSLSSYYRKSRVCIWLRQWNI